MSSNSLYLNVQYPKSTYELSRWIHFYGILHWLWRQCRDKILCILYFAHPYCRTNYGHHSISHFRLTRPWCIHTLCLCLSLYVIFPAIILQWTIFPLSLCKLLSYSDLYFGVTLTHTIYWFISRICSILLVEVAKLKMPWNWKMSDFNFSVVFGYI